MNNHSCEPFVQARENDSQWWLRSPLLPVLLLAVCVCLSQMFLLMRSIKLLFNTMGLFLLVASPFDVMASGALLLWHTWRHCTIHDWPEWHWTMIRYVNAFVGCQSMAMDVVTYLLIFAQLEAFCTIVAARNRGCFKVFVRIPVTITCMCTAAIISWQQFFVYVVDYDAACHNVYTRFYLTRAQNDVMMTASAVYPWLCSVLPLGLILLFMFVTALAKAGSLIRRACTTRFKQLRYPKPFKHVLVASQLVILIHVFFNLIPRTIQLNPDYWTPYIEPGWEIWVLSCADLVIALGYVLRPATCIFVLTSDLLQPKPTVNPPPHHHHHYQQQPKEYYSLAASYIHDI